VRSAAVTKRRGRRRRRRRGRRRWRWWWQRCALNALAPPRLATLDDVPHVM